MTKPNLAKQRTVTGAFSHDANTNTGRDLADCNFGNFTGTRDKVRDAGGGSDYNSLPSDRPNYYTGPDGFKLGKKVPGIDDDDSSRALQKGWHRAAGFSGVVSTNNNHPGKGTTNMRSRGTDTDTADQGFPKGTKFLWQ